MATIRTDISLAENVCQQINNLAKEMNISSNQQFTLAMQEYLQPHHANKIIESINNAYADALDEPEQRMLEKMRHHQRYLHEKDPNGNQT